LSQLLDCDTLMLFEEAKAMDDQTNGTAPQSEPEDLGALYAKFRRAFTAADLQKYTEVEEGIPADQLLAELEEIHRRESESAKQE